jgi:phytoene dehydrogenase-like protein
MAAFSQLKLDMTAWAMIYLGIVQRVANAMPVGGTGALPKALEQCFLAHGGQVRTDARVAELNLEGDRVVGVTLESGEKIRAREGVMTTCNPIITLTQLLPAGTLTHKLDARAKDIPIRKTHATSLKINVATSGKITMEKHRKWRKDKLDPTGILVAWATLEEQSAAWDATVKGEWYHPMPVHCSIVPSRVDPTQAPEGGDTFWLWSGIPPVNPVTPWEEVREEVGRTVLKDAAQYYVGLDSYEIGRAVLCGPDLEKRFNAPAGNVYHVDPYQRLYGHPGLHVVDGSALSANLGVNPSLTITAQAERAMAFWPNRGEPDPRPALGEPYTRLDPVRPRSPVVPAGAPAALDLPWPAVRG